MFLKIKIKRKNESEKLENGFKTIKIVHSNNGKMWSDSHRKQ